MNKSIIKTAFLIIIGLITGIGVSYFSVDSHSVMYMLKGGSGFHEFMTEAREYGIHKAEQEGNYRCCIKPACTMCYSEGNKWNYGQAGTCACDDLIAQGKEPCPQCARALSCDSSTEATIPEGQEGVKCPVEFD